MVSGYLYLMKKSQAVCAHTDCFVGEGCCGLHFYKWRKEHTRLFKSFYFPPLRHDFISLKPNQRRCLYLIDNTESGRQRGKFLITVQRPKTCQSAVTCRCLLEPVEPK